jgi:hypothetical protein
MTQPEKPDTEELETRRDKRLIRFVENFFFVAACSIMALYGVAETLHRVGFRFGTHSDEDIGFPWGLLIMCGFMVLPKVAGRASAGRIYEGIANRFGGK